MSDSLRPHGLYVDCKTPPVHGISQARILELVAISFSDPGIKSHLLHWQMGSLPLGRVCSIEPKKFNLETLRRWQVNKGVKDDDVSATQRRQRKNVLDGRKGRFGDFEMGNNIWF